MDLRLFASLVLIATGLGFTLWYGHRDTQATIAACHDKGGSYVPFDRVSLCLDDEGKIIR